MFPVWSIFFNNNCNFSEQLVLSYDIIIRGLNNNEIKKLYN